ncbi:MAG: hypothetical protein LBR74_00620 [Eubacterium sp.]|nr:hypothetical protein [Eubacterium sp.]
MQKLKRWCILAGIGVGTGLLVQFMGDWCKPRPIGAKTSSSGAIVYFFSFLEACFSGCHE